MFKPVLEEIRKELSGKRAVLDVRRLWQFRVTVPGPALRASAHYCARRFREVGVQHVSVIPYKADGKTLYGTYRTQLEWRPRSASLSIVSPREEAGRITSFEEEPISLISYSHGTPKHGVTAEVVIVEDGTKSEHYEGLDVKGKIVLTSCYARQVEPEASKRGAIGIISDSIARSYMAQHPPMRQGMDAPDAVHWNCLSGGRNGTKLFGFSLSPRQGQRLRNLIRSSEQPVMLHAEVDADIVAGTSELVSALLKGKERPQEELWVLAHISEPGARDNASGLASSIEIARTLITLVSQGKLPPLKRSIRFMFAVEVSGFLPHIHQNRRKLQNVLAGLTLDAVGYDLMRFGSELVFYRAPDHAATCTDDLMESLIAFVARMPAELFGEENYACFPHHMEPFWGNDSFIADPYFDIPSPQISTWPDRYYHTSMDRPEQMSDSTMKRIGVIAATYLYFLANAEGSGAAWLASRSAAFSKGNIARAIEEEMAVALGPNKKDARECVNNLLHTATLERVKAKDAIQRAERFAPRSARLRKAIQSLEMQIEEFAGKEEANALQTLRRTGGKHFARLATGRRVTPRGSVAAAARKLVPRRLSWRLPPGDFLKKKTLRELEKFNQRWGSRAQNARAAWPWADGRKNILQIWEIVDGKDMDFLKALAEFFRIYHEGGWIVM